MTHTRTHVHVEFADPFLVCETCRLWVTGWHADDRCGCDAGTWNEPCGHSAGVASVCPSWGPVDGCSCLQHLGSVSHGSPEPTSQ